ncbi:hypothetical protein Q5752_005060 [Cryptotrichosporon argae]
MQHTISPSPDSHGLGIHNSTISPTPNTSHTPPRFTGACFASRPSPTRQASGLSTSSGLSASSSHSNSPARGAPLYQPTFALRRTHSREAFASFSAIPPSPMRAPMAGPRSAGNSPAGKVLSSASVRSEVTTRLRPSRSSDLLAKWTRSESAAGAYQQIPDAPTSPSRQTSPEAPSRSRSGTISTVAQTPSSASHAMFPRDAWPTPPANHPFVTSNASPTRQLPRSQSTPLALGAVPEIAPAENADTHSHPFFTRLDHAPQPQRLSDSMAAHSGNLALFAAEQGGMIAFSPTGAVRQAPNDTLRSELESRPWSESEQSPHLGGGGVGAARPSHRPRALSDGAAMLARQGTLFHPSSSKERSSAELGVMLGGRARRLSAGKLLPAPEHAARTAGSSWDKDMDKVRLEASKKGKARVEVDVVLERECVVEGGEVRGRLEVLVRGGKRGEGLRVGGAKVRVLGFEDVSASARHIFYHQQHALPLFANPPLPDGPTSSLFGSEPDSEGYRLAVEGMHTVPFRVRLPLDGGAKGSYTAPGGKGPCVRYVVVGSVKLHIPSTAKRAIAHFYRPVTILPYLNPSIVLVPTLEPIEARVESGLGWSLKGEKGKVEVRVALGRKVWVCGQRAWCEVSIRNDSGKKVNKIALALLQTVSVYDSQTEVAGCMIRPTAVERTHIDAVPTSTQRRKVAEEVLEADFADRGAGRVTGKGWWTGVEPGERGQWDMSLQIPTGMVSVHRSRLIDVGYMLRVTVNGSIYLDVPIELINFLSMDPPPMPGDAPPYVSPQVQMHAVYAANDSLNTARMPARASSTTLHIDALLQQGRARAEHDGVGNGTSGSGSREFLRSRPMSMGSDYSGERLSRNPSVATATGAHPHSYRSTRAGGGSEAAMSDDEGNRAFLDARRTQGRQLSLALIKAVQGESGDDAAAEAGTPRAAYDHDGEAFRPDRTPSERHFHVTDTPSVDTHEGATPMPPPSHAPDLEMVDELSDVMDMVQSNGATVGHGDNDRSPTLVLGDTSYDIYAEMGLESYRSDVGDGSVHAPESVEDGEATPRAGLDAEMQDPLVPPSYPQRRLNSIVSLGGGSEIESELGQVFEATRGEARPTRLLSLDPPARSLGAGQRRGSHTPAPLRVESPSPEPRRGSSPLAQGQRLRRESNSSPLRPLDVPRASFSFGTQPSGSRRPSTALLSPSTSPRTLNHINLDQRRPSTSSQLRHEVLLESEAPGLAPSVASDSASSDGHLGSPGIPSDDWRPSTPPSLSTHDPHGHDADLAIPPSPASTAQTHHTHVSVESILPGVRSKIAQLESRDEALRKFSVASAASLHAEPAPIALPPAVTAPQTYAHAHAHAQLPQAYGTYTLHAPPRRQSYTAALAPRPVRSASDDASDRVGHTTFVPRKNFASRQSQSAHAVQQQSPIPASLDRTPSMCSNSTTATDVERALMRSPLGGPRGPRPLSKPLPFPQVAAMPMATEAAYGYEEFGRPGVVGKDETGSYGSTGWRGGGFRLPQMTFARGSVAEESEESEGLL